MVKIGYSSYEEGNDVFYASSWLKSPNEEMGKGMWISINHILSYRFKDLQKVVEHMQQQSQSIRNPHGTFLSSIFLH